MEKLDKLFYAPSKVASRLRLLDELFTSMQFLKNLKLGPTVHKWKKEYRNLL
jgi:hypothetical protein